MICPKCGAFISESNPICWSCGQNAKKTLKRNKDTPDNFSSNFTSNSLKERDLSRKDLLINQNFEENKHAHNQNSDYQRVNRAPKNQQVNKKSEEFYEMTWFVWLMLLTVYPIGLYLMWKYKKHNLFARLLITILMIAPMAIVLLLIIGFLSVPFEGNLSSTSLLSPSQIFSPNIDKYITVDDVSLKSEFGIIFVQGEISNSDDEAHSFSFNLGFYDDNDKLIRVVTGTVSDIQPHSTEVFEVIASEDIKNSKGYKLSIDTVIY